MGFVFSGMKRILICLTAGLLVAGMPSLQADETNTQSTAQTPGQKLQEMTPAERKAYLAEHPEMAKHAEERKAAMERMGISRKDLKGLPPEERQQKIKDAATKTVAELEQKKASSGLSAQEQTDLNYIKNNILGHKHHKPAADN
jgi:hypothetical protein